jgi:hypothetical protein
MKPRREFIAAAVVCLCLAIPFAAAVPNHSLQWGVEISEQFTYALQRKLGDASWINRFNKSLAFIVSMEEGQKAIVTVTNLQTIPSIINSTGEMPNSYCTLARENDSVQLVTNFTLFVVPIEDWSFLTQMSGFQSSGWTIINTDSEWGASLSLDIQDEQTITYYQDIRYEKQNGTLNYLRVRFSSLGNDLLDIVFVHWHTGMPTILGSELEVWIIFILLLGVGVASVVSVFVYRMYVGRKSIARRLGE